MTLLDDAYFGPFGAAKIARERENKDISGFEPWRRGTAFCQGCSSRKPIAGKSFKGWRCDDCKKPKKGT